MLTVDNVVKTQNSCELEGKKISKGSGGSAHETENKAGSSVGARESTSKMMVVAEEEARITSTRIVRTEQGPADEGQTRASMEAHERVFLVGLTEPF